MAVFKLSEESRLALKQGEGLQVCRHCFGLKYPHGLYQPECGAGAKVKQNLYLCKECLPPGLPEIDLRLTGGRPEETTIAFVFRLISESKRPLSPREVKRVRGLHGEHGIQMAFHHLLSRNVICRVGHGKYTATGISPLDGRGKKSNGLKVFIVESLKDREGMTVSEIQDDIEKRIDRRFSERSIRRRINELEVGGDLWRERDSSISAYRHYLISNKNADDLDSLPA